MVEQRRSKISRIWSGRFRSREKDLTTLTTLRKVDHRPYPIRKHDGDGADDLDIDTCSHLSYETVFSMQCVTVLNGITHDKQGGETSRHEGMRQDLPVFCISFNRASGSQQLSSISRKKWPSSRIMLALPYIKALIRRRN